MQNGILFDLFFLRFGASVARGTVSTTGFGIRTADAPLTALFCLNDICQSTAYHGDDNGNYDNINGSHSLYTCRLLGFGDNGDEQMRDSAVHLELDLFWVYHYELDLIGTCFVKHTYQN